MRLVHDHPAVLPSRVPRRTAVGPLGPVGRPAAHRVALGGAIVAASLALGVSVAGAHTQVAATSPSSSRPASTGVRSVTATFTGQIRSGTLTVRRGSSTVSKGRGGPDPRNVKRLRVGLRSGLRSGRYTASWTVEAADGHTQKGTFTFRLRRR